MDNFTTWWNVPHKSSRSWTSPGPAMKQARVQGVSEFSLPLKIKAPIALLVGREGPVTDACGGICRFMTLSLVAIICQFSHPQNKLPLSCCLVWADALLLLLMDLLQERFLLPVFGFISHWRRQQGRSSELQCSANRCMHRDVCVQHSHASLIKCRVHVVLVSVINVRTTFH